MIQPVQDPQDILVFANQCVFMRSIYLHGKLLFEQSSAKDKSRMTRSAPVFFGDLNRMFVEYLILQVCKITDPARDFRKNDNHTIAFLLQHYDFSSDPARQQRLAVLDARLQAFRQKLLPARNKVISHSDRAAIMAGHALGGVLEAGWANFWLELQELVGIMHEMIVGSPFQINGVGMLTDADGLLKALKYAECFEQLAHEGDAQLTHRCADLALTD
jgi:AbiU2